MEQCQRIELPTRGASQNNILAERTATGGAAARMFENSYSLVTRMTAVIYVVIGDRRGLLSLLVPT